MSEIDNVINWRRWMNCGYNGHRKIIEIKFKLAACIVNPRELMNAFVWMHIEPDLDDAPDATNFAKVHDKNKHTEDTISILKLMIQMCDAVGNKYGWYKTPIEIIREENSASQSSRTSHQHSSPS